MTVSRERLYRTEAIILKRSDFGEADRLLTFFTPHRGKLRAVAKGARKPGSRKSGHLELFSHSRLLLARGRNLDIVTQAETVEPFLPLREDLLRTTYAYYAAELTDRFSGDEDENRAVFDLLLAVFGWLSEARDLALVARFFELRLLSLVGYQPQLFQCLNCQTQIEPVINFFHPAEGGVLCPRCGEGRSEAVPLSLNTLKVLRFLQTRDYNTIQLLRVRPSLHAELEAVMLRYITYFLERNLKSVDFLQHLRLQMQVAVEE
jgi:DNA repair protein RecO (recombination protein O)